jgi:hypothetical protein
LCRSALSVQGETFRDVFALALSAPGVSALGSGQLRFAFGTNFSSNGMRVRSNNFTIDGRDNNAPGITGQQQPINNTDIIQRPLPSMKRISTAAPSVDRCLATGRSSSGRISDGRIVSSAPFSR